MDCRLPQKISAGLTFDRLVTATAYPAPEWTLVLMMRGPSAIDLTAESLVSNQHRFHATTGETSGWKPGEYVYSVRAVRGAEALEIDSGRLTIAPDVFSMAAGVDSRSHAQKCLENIEAVLEKRSTLDQDRYRINNRELYRTPVEQLMKLRDLYRAEVRRERQAASGKSLFQNVRVRLQ